MISLPPQKQACNESLRDCYWNGTSIPWWDSMTQKKMYRTTKTNCHRTPRDWKPQWNFNSRKGFHAALGGLTGEPKLLHVCSGGKKTTAKQNVKAKHFKEPKDLITPPKTDMTTRKILHVSIVKYIHIFIHFWIFPVSPSFVTSGGKCGVFNLRKEAAPDTLSENPPRVLDNMFHEEKPGLYVYHLESRWHNSH